MAFFAAPLWALTCRMWFTSLGVLATYALVILAAFILKFDQITTMAIVFGTSSIVGFCANDWRRMALVSRGWQTKGVAAAVDKDAALRRFIDLHPDVFHQPGNTPTY
ncbi:MAG: hypothetical protein CFH41_01092 [Alphaproteobacteria bacterium MarineAlpha11_Bin1]|nr:MAG: hypothetical protein CFH41_01092 [Alphaproteobacteria bacterium MarineAlpha11_Bin1]